MELRLVTMTASPIEYVCCAAISYAIVSHSRSNVKNHLANCKATATQSFHQEIKFIADPTQQ